MLPAVLEVRIWIPRVPKVAVEPPGGSGTAGARVWIETNRAAGVPWDPVRAVPGVTHNSRKYFPVIISGSVPVVEVSSWPGAEIFLSILLNLGLTTHLTPCG